MLVVPSVFVQQPAAHRAFDGEAGLRCYSARCRVGHRMAQPEPVQAKVVERPLDDALRGLDHDTTARRILAGGYQGVGVADAPGAQLQAAEEGEHGLCLLGHVARGNDGRYG